MTFSRLSLPLAVAALLAPAVTAPAAQMQKITAETITANAYVIGSTGTSTTPIAIQIHHYSTQADQEAVWNALTHGGYPAFLTALRKAPVVGTVSVAGQTVDIRWAREQSLPGARSIVLITDRPVYFGGGGSTNREPPEGDEVALMQYTLDDSGVSVKGSLAAAARVTPGGATGVQIDQYTNTPIELKDIGQAAR